MSESLNSQSNSTSTRSNSTNSTNDSNNSTSTEALKELAEEVAELDQNHDEVLDLELALGALGGLRHSAACSAAERSIRRFDERNHRLHESRMKDLGMDGEEKEPEAEDMSQKVLIRSPIIHNHYSDKPNQPATPTPASQPAASTVTPPQSGLSNLAKGAIVAGVLATGLGGAGATYLLMRPDTPAVISPDRPDKNWGLNLLPPDPRKVP